MKLLNQNNIVFLGHILCWLIFSAGVLFYQPSTWGIALPLAFWMKQLIVLGGLIAVFYINLNLLIPYLLNQKKLIIYIITALTLVIIVTILTNIINDKFNLNGSPFAILHSGHGDHGHDDHGEHHGHYNTFVPGMNLLMVGLGITVSFIGKWQQELNLRQQLEKEKITTELTLLKAQINPHFFFNTLNTIYSYTLSDGEVARTAITNLSKMMRYVLYDGTGNQTTLNKEVAFICEYTELMKLRISLKTTVSLKAPDNAGDVLIAPMLFLPFVENAFKHGVSTINEGHINITITQDTKTIILTVSNTVHGKHSVNEELSNGIGILNTTRRLELLYPGRFTLSYGLTGNGEYVAKLTVSV